MHRTEDLSVRSPDHTPFQRGSQHTRLHRRRPDPWFEAISTGRRYSRHPSYQRPPRDTSVATVLQAGGQHCNDEPAHQFIGHTQDKQQNLVRLHL